MSANEFQEKVRKLSEDKNFRQLIDAINKLKLLQKKIQYNSNGGLVLDASIREKISAMEAKIKENDVLNALFGKVSGELLRSHIVQYCIDASGGKTYVEIGVRAGETFCNVAAERKIGIDPMAAALAVKEELTKGESIHYYQMTSDDFFRTHKDLFANEKIDVAFVDGLHTYEQSLRDVCHCLDHMTEEGVVIIHDCNPQSEAAAIPVTCEEDAKKCAAKMGLPLTSEWEGDVWKTIAYLRSMRNDLFVCVLDCDFGVGIVTKGRAENPVCYSAGDIDQLTYHDLSEDRMGILNLKQQEYIYQFLSFLQERKGQRGQGTQRSKFEVPKMS